VTAVQFDPARLSADPEPSRSLPPVHTSRPQPPPQNEPGDFTRQFASAAPAQHQPAEHESGDFSREFGRSAPELPPVHTSRPSATPQPRPPADDFSARFRTPAIPNERAEPPQPASGPGDFTRQFGGPAVSGAERAAGAAADLPWFEPPKQPEQRSQRAQGVPDALDSDDPIFSETDTRDRSTDPFRPPPHTEAYKAPVSAGPGDYTRVISVAPPPAAEAAAPRVPAPASGRHKWIPIGLLTLIGVAIVIVLLLFLR
jgi:hypothetical protein